MNKINKTGQVFINNNLDSLKLYALDFVFRVRKSYGKSTIFKVNVYLNFGKIYDMNLKLR